MSDKQNTNDKIKAFAVGGATLVLSNLVLKAINFFLLPLYTNYLSTEQLGISDTIQNLASFIFPILVMGMDSAISAFYYDQDSEQYHQKVFNSAFFSLAIASIVPIILCLIAVPLSEVLFQDQRYQLAIIISLASVSLNLWYLPYSILMRIQNRMTVFALINIAASTLMIVLNILFVSVLQWGAYAMLTSTCIVNALQLLLYIPLSKMPLSFRKIDFALLKRMFTFSLPLIPTVVANWVLTLSDRYVILAYRGEAEVGLYGIAARFSNILYVVTSGIYMAYTTFAFQTKNDENAPKLYAKVLDVLFICIAVICFVVSLFGKELVSWMTTPTYHTAYWALASLMFAQLLYAINTIVGYGISFAKKTGYHMVSVWVGAIVNLILNFILIPKYGFSAAALTTLIGYAIMTFLAYRFAQKLYPCEYRMVRITVATVILYATCILAMDAAIWLKGIVLLVGLGLLCWSYWETLSEIISFAKVILKRVRGR